MQAISVKELEKTFRVKRKEKGMRGSVQAILRPQTEEVKAVRGVSFGVDEGESWRLSGQTALGRVLRSRC